MPRGPQDGADYTALRHARVDAGGVEVVAVGHWDFGDREEWCVEYWDARGEVDHDQCFPSEAEAIAHASQEFGLQEADWVAGPQRFGPAPP